MTNITIVILAATDKTPMCKSATAAYPNVYRFNSETADVSNTKKLYTVINKAIKDEKVLLKGLLKKPLVNESRAGGTSSEEPTQWICMDLDGVNLPDIETFLSQLPEAFHNTSYVVQESASLGTKKGLRHHIFMLLAQPISPIILKAILKHINVTVSALFEGISLGRGDSNVLLYPLDITTCQNDKLLYIAPRSDKKATSTHLQHIVKENELLDIEQINYRPASDKAALLKKRNTLRKEAGLPIRKTASTLVAGKELFTNVDEAIIAEIKEDNGFVRFNLKGSISKSFRYYHPKDNYEYIHSFGDEETMYATRTFFPAYYRSLTKQHEGKEYFAVRDMNTDQYYTVIINNGDVEYLRPTGSAKKAMDFCLEHGNKYDYIPTWNVVCDFANNTTFNRAEKYINIYTRSDYIQQATTPRAKPPALINRVILHMLGDDPGVLEHFYNWLAVIAQKGMRTQTAWLLHGTTGTGKGLVCDYIIRPLIGAQYTSKVRLSDFAERFNSFMSSNLILFINEAQMSALDAHKAGSAISNIKDCITDDVVRVEAKNKTTADSKNSCNLLFSSNQHDPIEIETNDRRINVAPRQETQLLDAMNEKDRRSIIAGDELQEFANYIMHRKASVQVAHTALNNRAKIAVQEATMDTHRALIYQIMHGDFSIMVLELATFEITDLNELSCFNITTLGEHALTYYKIITRMYYSAVNEEPISITRAELIVLFYCLLGYTPASVYKFSAHLGKNGVRMKNIRVDNKQCQGIGPIQFIASKETLKAYTAYNSRCAKSKNVIPIAR